jgi:hypothetical protein
VSAWLASLPADTDLARLATMAEWAAYAPEAPSPWTEEDVTSLCQLVLTAWSLSRWRRCVAAGGTV